MGAGRFAQIRIEAAKIRPRDLAAVVEKFAIDPATVPEDHLFTFPGFGCCPTEFAILLGELDGGFARLRDCRTGRVFEIKFLPGASA